MTAAHHAGDRQDAGDGSAAGVAGGLGGADGGVRLPKVVALGGGHGLSASLRALRRVTPHVTAVVTVADDGGSSGRLRAGRPEMLPPGDLRMAVCALADDASPYQQWADLLQHRFAAGELTGHPVGNVVLAGLLEQGLPPAHALATLAELVGAVGTVLPLADEPLEIEGDVVGLDPADPGGVTVVRGQVALAGTTGRVLRARILPSDPATGAEVLDAVAAADAIVLGPGSLFTSQLPHLLAPSLGKAIEAADGKVFYVLNLVPQPGESDGLDPAAHIEALRAHLPGFRPEVVLADTSAVPTGSPDLQRLEQILGELGAQLVHAPLATPEHPEVHDQVLLAEALRKALLMVQDGGASPGCDSPGASGRYDAADVLLVDTDSGGMPWRR